MTGTFIISLDCEGKWGMADSLTPHHHQCLTDAALADIYGKIVRLFARYDTPATFAYVMAFTLAYPEFQKLNRDLGLDDAEDKWLAFFRAEERKGRIDGWFQPKALEQVREDGRHEIACHSFCHRPMDDASLSDVAASAELHAAEIVATMKGLALNTFIFPRNKVGNLSALRRKGYLGYREELRRPSGALGKILTLSSEFNLLTQPQPAEAPGADGLVKIPPGYFFNWRFAARRHVPLTVTVRRWQNLLSKAAQTGGVAHLWLHPHNLITGPDTHESLEAVLAFAARLREKGQLNVTTQEAYCRDLLQAAA